MTKGTVLFHEKFKFPDGEHGEKLLVVLNTPAIDEPYLVCRTTSQCKYYITKEGCHGDKGIYHIKAKKDGFPCDTWIQLSPITALTKEEFVKAHLQDKICHIKHQLSGNTIGAILYCIWQGDDVSQYHLDILFKKKSN